MLFFALVAEVMPSHDSRHIPSLSHQQTSTMSRQYLCIIEASITASEGTTYVESRGWDGFIRKAWCIQLRPGPVELPATGPSGVKNPIPVVTGPSPGLRSRTDTGESSGCLLEAFDLVGNNSSMSGNEPRNKSYTKVCQKSRKWHKTDQQNKDPRMLPKGAG